MPEQEEISLIHSVAWNDKLNRAIEANDAKTLEVLAQDVINAAAKGDLAAIKEVFDAVDGPVDY